MKQSGAAHACPPSGERPLTASEIALARSVFGSAIDYDPVRIRRRKWFPFQPRRMVMAPLGHLHFYPLSSAYCDDFALASLPLQGFLIHEMVHVWQVQARGRWHLILNRMPWAGYNYSLVPGRPLSHYGIEQQADIVKHAFLLRKGESIAGVADSVVYEELLDFGGERA